MRMNCRVLDRWLGLPENEKNQHPPSLKCREVSRQKFGARNPGLRFTQDNTSACAPKLWRDSGPAQITLGASCGRLSPLGSQSKGPRIVETDCPLGFCLPQCPLLVHVQCRCGRISYRFLRYGAGSFVVGEGVGYSNDRAVAQSRRGLFALWF